LVTWGLAAGCIFLAFYFLKSYHGPFKKWIALAVTLGLMLPWFIFQASFPLPLDLTAYSDAVDYEFKDANYAEEFAELNSGALEMDG
jgi:hypothetical protein